jgi:hypothetical protein
MKMLLALKTKGGATIGSVDLATSRARFRFSKTGFHNIDTVRIKPKRKGVVTRATLAGNELLDFGIENPAVVPEVPVTFKPGKLAFWLDPKG